MRAFLLVLDYFVAEVAFAGVFHDDAGYLCVYQRDLVDSSMKASLYEMMLGWRMEARILI